MSILDSLPVVVVDPKSTTALEIVAHTGMGRSWVDRLIKSKLVSGEWEKVFKKVGCKLTPAYRQPIKKNKGK